MIIGSCNSFSIVCLGIVMIFLSVNNYVQQHESWRFGEIVELFPPQANVLETPVILFDNVTAINSTISPSPEPTVSESITLEPINSESNTWKPTLSINNSSLEDVFATSQPAQSMVPRNTTNSHKRNGSVPYTTKEEFLNATKKYVFHYDPPSGSTLVKYLFIVNFHWHKYKESVFISNTYFKKFSTYFNSSFDMVMVGPSKDRKYHVLSNGLPKGGYYSYYSMPFVYNLLCKPQACNYTGFFFMNDDSYIDAQFLNTYNLTQSWAEKYSVYNPKRCSWKWPKVKNKYGVLFSDAYNRAIKELMSTKLGKLCKFDKGSNKMRGWADAFYLTASDVEIFNEIALVMYKHGVFLEMATPTAMWCLTQNTFDNCNHGKMPNRLTCVHLHPLKYRQPYNKQMALERLDHMNMNKIPHIKY